MTYSFVVLLGISERCFWATRRLRLKLPSAVLIELFASMSRRTLARGMWLSTLFVNRFFRIHHSSNEWHIGEALVKMLADCDWQSIGDQIMETKDKKKKWMFACIRWCMLESTCFHTLVAWESSPWLPSVVNIWSADGHRQWGRLRLGKWGYCTPTVGVQNS